MIRDTWGILEIMRYEKYLSTVNQKNGAEPGRQVSGLVTDSCMITLADNLEAVFPIASEYSIYDWLVM